MTLRLQRVREMLKRALGEIIRRDFPPGDGSLITVNEITVTPDLKEAKAFIGVVGHAGHKRRAMARLAEKRGHIQFQLGRAIVLKYTPRVEFILDEAIERGNRVLEILETIEQEKPLT